MDIAFFRISGLVSDHVLNPILGVDFLLEQDASWQFGSAEIGLGGYRHKLYPREKGSWHRKVVTCNRVLIPARFECLVKAKVIFNDFSNSV